MYGIVRTNGFFRIEIFRLFFFFCMIGMNQSILVREKKKVLPVSIQAAIADELKRMTYRNPFMYNIVVMR